MTPQEELEKIINNSGIAINSYNLEGDARKVIVRKDKVYTNQMIKDLAQAILDAGFVRLEDVELDEEKIIEILKSGCIVSRGHSYSPIGLKDYIKQDLKDDAHALHEAKGIIRGIGDIK